MTSDDEILGKAYDSRLMRRLLTYLACTRRSTRPALLAIIANSAAQLAPPYLTKVAIDRYIAAGHVEGLARWRSSIAACCWRRSGWITRRPG